MKRLIASFAALLFAAVVVAQQSSGPVASPADLVQWREEAGQTRRVR